MSVAISQQPDAWLSLHVSAEKACCIWTINNFSSRSHADIDSFRFCALLQEWRLTFTPGDLLYNLTIYNESYKPILAGIVAEIVNEKGVRLGGRLDREPKWVRFRSKGESSNGEYSFAIMSGLVLKSDLLDPITGYITDDTLRLKLTFHTIKQAFPSSSRASTSKLCSTLREAKKFRWVCLVGCASHVCVTATLLFAWRAQRFLRIASFYRRVRLCSKPCSRTK